MLPLRRREQAKPEKDLQLSRMRYESWRIPPETANNIQSINALVTQAVNKLANNSNAIVEYIDGTIMPDYDRFVENGVQYRDDAAYVNTTMDHFEEKARNLQQIMEKTVDSIRDISTAIEESANSVGNAASSTTVLVSNIDTVHSEMETNQSISDRLKGSRTI